MKGNEPPTYITTAALSDIYSPFLSFIELSSRRGPHDEQVPRGVCEACRMSDIPPPPRYPTDDGHTALKILTGFWRENDAQAEANNVASLSRSLPHPSIRLLPAALAQVMNR